MAEMPQAEQTGESCSCMPSKALYMDWNTALYRAKALFVAIEDLVNGGRVDKEDLISKFACLVRQFVKIQSKR